MSQHTEIPMRFVFQRQHAPTFTLANWTEGSQNSLYKPDNPTSIRPFSSPQRAPSSAASSNKEQSPNFLKQSSKKSPASSSPVYPTKNAISQDPPRPPFCNARQRRGFPPRRRHCHRSQLHGCAHQEECRRQTIHLLDLR